MRVQDLDGICLDWAVAKAGGGAKNVTAFIDGYVNKGMFHYSTDWAQGGPIIEREGIELQCNLSATEASRFVSGSVADWFACSHRKKYHHLHGDTPLKAAMRCYCYKMLGESVDIPADIASFS